MVYRDDHLTKVHCTNLVVGDIVKIVDGMDIPVDMLLIEGHEVICDESAMTGESDPVKKREFKACQELVKSHKENQEQVTMGPRGEIGKIKKFPSPCLISGTTVLNGEGRAMVMCVGKNT
mmetsp:Transcript_41765/g.37189  ORF Transcript_41765/g.37189 Transcript_41765/m.37189 type:complete len:120 (-) Transcript_41765:2750-3109(-)